MGRVLDPVKCLYFLVKQRFGVLLERGLPGGGSEADPESLLGAPELLQVAVGWLFAKKLAPARDCRTAEAPEPPYVFSV